MVPWLFPLGVLAALVLISFSNLVGYVLAMVWGWIVFPHAAAYIRSRARASGDADADYWRTKPL
jgi:hypothetical protein